jgi:recombination protein RecT
MGAAQDGLLPDGREGAIVPYSADAEGAASETAQWMPMIAGIRKKVRNSGALIDWNVQIVQEGDQFDYQLGDDPFIHHKPSMKGGRTRKVIAAYSIATFKDGSKSREVMNLDQIEDIKKKSRAKKGPWADPIFYPEMCRKTVARLHAKQLPMSTDLDTLMRRDDELYDLQGGKEAEKEQQQRRLQTTAAVLDHFGGGDGNTYVEGVGGDDDGTHVVDGTQRRQGVGDDDSIGVEIVQPQPESAEPAHAPSSAEASRESASVDSEAAPRGAPNGGPSKWPTAPKSADEYAQYTDHVLANTASADDIAAWWSSLVQKNTRNKINLRPDQFDALHATVKKRVEELGGTMK